MSNVPLAIAIQHEVFDNMLWLLPKANNITRFNFLF